MVGIGVNVLTPRFPPPLDGSATSLWIEGAVDANVSDVVCRLLTALDGHIARFFDCDGDLAACGVLAAIRGADALLGERIEVGGRAGVARGVDASGRLLLEVDDGSVVPVSAGEVRWR